MSNRFDKALEKIRTALSARRKREPNAPRVYFLPGFVKQLEAMEKEDSAFVRNLLKVLFADPDMPKRGRNVSGTRCHKTEMGKGNRAAMYRVIYYHRKAENDVYYILTFAKSDQDNLTDDQAKKVNYITDGIDNRTIKLISLDGNAP